MKFTTLLLLFIACVTGINTQNGIRQSPKCKAAIDQYNNSKEGKIFSECKKYRMNELDEICANPNCRTLSVPEAVRSACNKNENDKMYIKLVDEILVEMNKTVKDICENKSIKPDKQNTKPKTKIEQQLNPRPVSSKCSSSNSSNTSTNTSCDDHDSNNVTSNNITGNNAALNNGAGSNFDGNNTTSNFNGVVPGNSTNPTLINETNISSAGYKLSYSLVTIFVLTAFQLLL